MSGTETPQAGPEITVEQTGYGQLASERADQRCKVDALPSDFTADYARRNPDGYAALQKARDTTNDLRPDATVAKALEPAVDMQRALNILTNSLSTLTPIPGSPLESFTNGDVPGGLSRMGANIDPMLNTAGALVEEGARGLGSALNSPVVARTGAEVGTALKDVSDGPTLHVGPFAASTDLRESPAGKLLSGDLPGAVVRFGENVKVALTNKLP